MTQVIRDFKAIMADKHERKEFIGGLACVVIMMALAYITIVIFY